jgi:hypothetical protein
MGTRYVSWFCKEIKVMNVPIQMEYKQIFKRGALNNALNRIIKKDCKIRDDSYRAQLLDLIHHVDTDSLRGYAGAGDDEGWRVQGYVYLKDIVNKDFLFPENARARASYMDKEFVLMLTFKIIKPKKP